MSMNDGELSEGGVWAGLMVASEIRDGSLAHAVAVAVPSPINPKRQSPAANRLRASPWSR